MKIVQFVGAMDVGGSENLLMNVLRNIDRSAYSFIFMENVGHKTHYTDEIQSLGSSVVKTPPFSGKGIVAYYRFMVEYFQNEGIDVVHAHTYLHSWIVLAAAKRAGVPRRIAHAHSAMTSYDNGSRLKWWLLKKLLVRNATDLIACSSDARDDLFNGDERTVIIKNSVDLSRFDSIVGTDIEELRQRYDLHKDTYVIGHIGRMVQVKNPIFICEIAKKLKDDGFKFKLLWLGDGTMRSDIESYIVKNELTEYIELVGNVNAVPQHIKLFDVFVMPSLWEGLSLAAVEVQSEGIPCLFSDTVSRDTRINSNVDFLPISNPDVWASAIASRPERVERRAAHRAISSAGMDISTTVERFVKCYEV